MALLIEWIYECDGPLGTEDEKDYPEEKEGLSISTDKDSYVTYRDTTIKIVMENNGQED